MQPVHAEKSVNIPFKRFNEGKYRDAFDDIVIEAPLLVTCNTGKIFKLLRTPGDDNALILGWLYSSKIINCTNDVMRIIPDKPLAGKPVTAIKVELVKDISVKRTKAKKSTIITKKSLPKLLRDCRRQIENHQETFKLTGSSHAAGIFSENGEMLGYGEDVGRHNALDKAIGYTLLSNRMNKALVAFTTSRASHEIASKAAQAGMSVLGVVSGVTSMAIESAKSYDMLLAAFVRGNRMNIYHANEILKR